MLLMMSQVLTLLKEHQLLKNVTGITPNETFEEITYDSRNVKENTLFFCKGNFNTSYLISAKKSGATAYVAEIDYPEGSDLTAIIVTNVQKAMALLGAAFYNYPQNELFIVAFTGTKGKTTSAYFTHSIMQQSTNGHAALFSTIDQILGPNKGDRFKSNLTTPESLDLFRNMRTAVTNGMTHLVMEVSSQAYKKNRVYGLIFDIGIFLNISPDHIGKNEHMTFDDYLYCKKQLLVNSRISIINAETSNFWDVYYAAKTSTKIENLYLYGRQEAVTNTVVDVAFNNQSETLQDSDFIVVGATQKGISLGIDGSYTVHLPGYFNESNAVSAAMAASLAGAKASDINNSLVNVHVPGRMEMIDVPEHGLIYIDYAHNYASMKALLGFLHEHTGAGKVIVVLGSTGDKGVSRRKGFGQVLSEEADIAILTTDDPGFENPIKIAKEIDDYIDHDRVTVKFVMNRMQAIKIAIEMSHDDDVVVLAGKGEDAYQKINGIDTPYVTDVTVAKKVVKELS